MKRYTLGHAVTKDSVVVIRKTKPARQAGMINFVGGKIEPGESPGDCMTREFWEETGVQTSLSDWRSIGRIFRANGNEDDFEIFMFYSENEAFKGTTTTTEEIVFHIPRENFRDSFLRPLYMPNLATIFEFVNSSDYKEYSALLTIQIG